MAEELELKAVVPDVARLRDSLAAAGAERSFAGRMHDRRYDRNGELAPRDEVLRVRTFQVPGQPDHWRLGWKGPTRRSPEGYKLREELECEVVGAASPATVLEALGYRPVHAVNRYVEIFTLGDATVRIETYPRMDVLVEVEGTPAAIERAIAGTCIPRAAFSAEALDAFVARFEAREHVTALLAEPPE